MLTTTMGMFAVGASGEIAALKPSAIASAEFPPISCDPNDPGACTCGGAPIGPDTWTPPSWLFSPHKSIFETSAFIEGVETPLSKFKGPKATMVVNVASA